LPMVDIHDKWQHVAADALVALICTVPGASVISLLYMVKHYLCRRWSMIFPKHDNWRKKLRQGVLGEGLTWIVVASATLEDTVFVFGTDTSTFSGAVSNEPNGQFSSTYEDDFAVVPVYIIGNACMVGAFLLLRILVIQTIEVAADVHSHKMAALREPKENNFKHPGMGRRARLMLSRLHDTFPDCYQKEEPPTTIHDVARSWETTETHLGGMVWASSIILFVLLSWLQISVFYGSKTLWPDVQNNKQRLFIGGLLTRSLFAASSWYSLVRGILCTTAHMKSNANQLLLFTTLTNYSKVDTWSKKDRTSLKSVLFNNQAVGFGGGLPDDDDLQHILDGMLGKDRLDLMNLDDIKAWWDLRRYVQIDFMDESAMMDYCGVLVIMLLACFVLSGVLDWLAHADVFSPGIILVVTLGVCLSIIMLDVIQVCIDINHILERDSMVLVDAAADAILSKRPDAVEVATMLRAVERKVDMFDDRQQVLGVTMTANYRNGWILSVGLAMLSGLWELLRTMRTDVLHWIDEADFVWWNVTDWAWKTFSCDDSANDTVALS